MTSIVGPEYHERVEGTWGEFRTESGRVEFVMTNARLGPAGPDLEHRLTRQLRPVREVLSIANLDFGQLLQRDLDDHRVATELVPYLLSGARTGPAFFPPVLAVLLPFDHAGSPSDFPAMTDSSVDGDGGMTFERRQYSDAFQVQRLWDDEGASLARIRYGRLSWNSEHAKVVVLDGQHRAMALLAIDRTLNDGWEDAGRGARYRHFYEDRVRAALETGEGEAPSQMQIPVTVCWFPDLVGEGSQPHIAARTLFVDVNKTAKTPSPDRVVLLSDDDLLNIFVREMLNGLRGRDTDPPLAAIEYDNPTRRSGPPTKWSAVSSLQALVEMVERSMFVGAKYVERVDVPVRGRPPETDRDAFLRSQLRITDLMSRQVATSRGVHLREDISRYHFPREALPALTQGFMASWGDALTHLLGNVLPYAAHYEALRRLEEEWQPADESAVEALAREAIFEGVGMYWILLNSHRHWQSEGVGDVDVPDVVSAWTRLGRKRDVFREMRAEAYLGDAEAAHARELCDGLFSVVSTQACQAGLALTLATLCDRTQAHGNEVVEMARALTSAINAGLVGPDGGRSRRLCLAQTVEPPLNRIANMKPDRAIEFRYLWLEIVSTPEGTDALSNLAPDIDIEVVHDLRDLARNRYTTHLIDEGISERRRRNRSQTRAALQVPVTVEVTSVLQRALSEWFGVSRTDFDRWAADADLTVPDDDEFDDEN